MKANENKINLFSEIIGFFITWRNTLIRFKPNII